MKINTNLTHQILTPLIRYLKKATELNSGDYEAWIELAQLTELTDLPGALAGKLLNYRHL